MNHTHDPSVSSPLEVAIVGAGPGGLVAAKSLLEKDIQRIVVFEETSSMGGIWNLEGGKCNPSLKETPSIPDNSSRCRLEVPCLIHHPESGEVIQKIPSSSLPIYQDLKVNLPKDMMSFLGHSFPPDLEFFPGPSAVGTYYQEYGRKFQVDKVTQFNTRVEECIKDHETDLWTIQTRNVQTGEVQRVTSRRLLVCNGHFRKPFCPYVSGLDTFPGRLLHSSAFEETAEFSGKTVLIVGGGVSGCDIAKLLLEGGNCTRVVISVRKWKALQQLFLPRLKSKGLVVRPCVEKFLIDGRVSFAPNPKASGKVYDSSFPTESPDVVIFATGYRYHFPFLENSTPKHPLRFLRDDGFKMERLYKRMLSIDDPTLAFFGITNLNLSPTIVMEYQAKWFVQKVVQQSLTSLRKMYPAMLVEVNSRANDKTQDLLFTKNPSYCNSLARDIGARGYWMQLILDRLPLVAKSFWARLRIFAWTR